MSLSSVVRKGMASVTATATRSFITHQNPNTKTLHFSLKRNSLPISNPTFSSTLSLHAFNSLNRNLCSFKGQSGNFSCNCMFSTATSTTNYQFFDNSSEVELRLPLVNQDVENSRDIYVDADGTSLVVRIQRAGSWMTLIETNQMFEKIKPAETIWYIDDDQLVINLKKQDPELNWPDIVESWESLTAGSTQLLRGASIYLIGDSTEINQKVARELAVGLGYTPLDTQELLETFAKQTIDSWIVAESHDSVAEAESAILESLSSHVRAVVSTLGGKQGAARKSNKWQHLYAGFTVWLSQTEATDEDLAKEEARRHVQDGNVEYSKADVVVKLQGWDSDHAKSVAQASLSALKQLILSDKKLPDKKSLYIRLGCRGDWPNIKPPGGIHCLKMLQPLDIPQS